MTRAELYNNINNGDYIQFPNSKDDLICYLNKLDLTEADCDLVMGELQNKNHPFDTQKVRGVKDFFRNRSNSNKSSHNYHNTNCGSTDYDQLLLMILSGHGSSDSCKQLIKLVITAHMTGSLDSTKINKISQIVSSNLNSIYDNTVRSVAGVINDDPYADLGKSLGDLFSAIFNI